MQVPPLTDNEIKRLEALKKYRILDTAPEEIFDDITYLASHLCGTPVALISLVDESRQWFKSNIGFNAKQISRDGSFCAHAIAEDGLFEIPDALQDPRFNNNPLVIDNPNIRFYTGTPLVMPNGYKLGTLCVLEQVPRQLSAAQRLALEKLDRK